MARLLLTGTFNSLNKGDAAMQIAAAKALSGAIDGAEIEISSPFPALDAPFYAPFRVAPSSRRRLVWSALQLFRACLWRIANRHFGRDFRLFASGSELRSFIEADLVIDLSGDMLTEDYGPHLAYSHFIPIVMALILRKPVFLCAQSIGPFHLTKFLARRVLNRVDLITARDEISLRLMKDVGVQNSELFLTADLSFLLDPAPAERIDVVFDKEGIPRDGRPILGVTLSNIVKRRFERGRPRGSLLGFAGVMAGILDDLSRQFSAQILFIPHVVGPTPAQDDRTICAETQKRMKGRSFMIAGNYSPQELKGVISRCHVLIGARMHASMAALSTGVPVVAISYSHKFLGIMASFGQEGLVCPAASLTHEDLLGKVADVWARRDAIASRLRERFGPIKAASYQNIEMAIKLLERKVRASQVRSESANGGRLRGL